MALLKCKMCGGDLEATQGTTVCVCEYCGTRQTVPSLDNEKKLNLFTRANKLRFGCEFDKAYSMYETILIDYPNEAEAYWGLVLCKYGIEYVDDPSTGKKIPTCHRSSFESVLDDSNYEQAIENSDLYSRDIYREEANAIEEVRKGIVEISSKEEPYDIFICYKETAPNGDRTIDSVIAQDVYDELTKKGYRVFFSRITLEDTLGKEYEPYIFSALHSAKIMLAFGTCKEYYNAVWVKNEWSRFIKLIESNREKVLIPCYKGIDAYDMPKEFAKLQAQDMGKIGAIQDLLRGIEKILPLKKEKETVVVQASGMGADFFAPVLQKAKNQLKRKNFSEAKQSYQKVLDFMPSHQEALFGVLLSAMKVTSFEEMESGTDLFNTYQEYVDVYDFCDEEAKERFANALQKIKDNNGTALNLALERGEFENAQKYANNVLSIDNCNENAKLSLLLANMGVPSLEALASGTTFFDEGNFFDGISPELRTKLDQTTEAILNNNQTEMNNALFASDYDLANEYANNILAFDGSNEDAKLSLLLANMGVPSLESLAEGTDFFDEGDFFEGVGPELRRKLNQTTESIKNNNYLAMDRALHAKDFDLASDYARNVLNLFPSDSRAIIGAICCAYGVENTDKITTSEIPILKNPVCTKLSEQSDEYKSFFDKAAELQKNYFRSAIKEELKRKRYPLVVKYSKILIQCDPKGMDGHVGLLLGANKVSTIRELPIQAVDTVYFRNAVVHANPEVKKQLLYKKSMPKKSLKIALIIIFSILAALAAMVIVPIVVIVVIWVVIIFLAFFISFISML